MSLVSQIDELLKYINANKPYLEANAELLNVYDGNLLPILDRAIQPPNLSEQYYKQIKERIIPINVLRRIAEKTSRAYITRPERVSSDRYEASVKYYENQFALDQKMQTADIYTTLFKGYALEPFIHMGQPKLRVLPYDRFLPYSDDPVDPTYVTHFIKFMGKRTKTKGNKTYVVEAFHVFTATEFLSFDSEGEVIESDMALNMGINPYGVIPFIYGNRGNDTLIPVRDTDTMALTKMIPLLLTDLSGAIMFQCFSIVWGIDVNAENLTMSPNAFWSLKSDITSQKEPKLGTIKPEADIQKVLDYITSTFTFWLETRGIRIGSVGQIDAANASSGIAKIIDEMDSTELVQKSQMCFQHDESMFWSTLKQMSNYWLSQSLITTNEKPEFFMDDFQVITQFDPPQPQVDRATEVNTVKMERDAGFISTRKAIEQLYPDLTEEQIENQLMEIDQERGVEPSGVEEDVVAENEDSTT